MKDEHNNNKKTTPPLSHPSSKQKNQENERKDDKAKSVHDEDSGGSANSTKPGAVALKSGDASKIMKRREKFLMKRREKFLMKSKASIDRAGALPGHQPINEEPGYYIKKKDVNSEKIAKKIPKDTSKATSPGVIAMKNK